MHTDSINYSETRVLKFATKLKNFSSFGLFMLSSKMRQHIAEACIIANQLAKPYIRLCADIRTNPPVSREMYSEIKKDALAKYDNALFHITTHKEKLMSMAESHLKNFPYIFMSVDGIKINGNTNLQIWMLKPDIEKVKPSVFMKTFEDISDLLVGERVTWEELFENIKDEKAIQRIAGMHSEFLSYGIDKPPVIKKHYQIGVMEEKSLFMKLPKPYSSIPPFSWEFYGEKPAPDFILELEKRLYSNF